MNDQEQMHFFYQIFDASLPRLGPGDDVSTTKALHILFSAMPHREVPPESARLSILDLGCGTGAQTIQLAKNIDGTILAVDNHQPYLEELRRRAEAEGVSGKIKPWLKDMCALELDDGAFDVIWSEGALYCMGFREGLAACRRWLAPNGFLAATELCWRKPEPPAECREFFTGEYPAMIDIDANLSAIRASGYKVLDHFVLPESAWWDQYYRPLEERLRVFRQEHAGCPGKLEVIESSQREINIYRKYADYYGYVFYLMQR